MKKIVITAILSVVIGLAGGWLIFHSTSHRSSSAERRILFYRDPMNPQNTSPTPKKAPDGMDFVPVYEEARSGTGEKKIAYYRDPMHPWFTSDKPGKAPDCGMDLVPVYEGESDGKGIKIDPVVVQNIGVKVEEVVKRKLNKTIRTVGKVDYDERRVYSVNSKIMGWVEKLYVDYTGKLIHKGEPLMELYSPELVSTQEEYLQALRYRKKLQESSLEEARTGSDDLIQSARRRLQYWDIPESEIKALEERGTPNKTMTIYSPVDGVVIEKMVQKGQNIMGGMELYKIADLSTVWVLADVYQYELPWVKVGGKIEIELSYLPGKSFKGTLTYIYPYLSMETKTAKVRVEVQNTQSFELKPDMYATVKISSPVNVYDVAVPDGAIIRSGERNIVVMSLGGGYFDPREVKLGVSAEGYVQILDGIRAGEKIVVSSQFLIDSESNLKAAISQMAGHADMPPRQDGTKETGGDMSKPMEGQKHSAGEHKGHQITDTAKAEQHGGHEMNQQPVKKEKRARSQQRTREMQDAPASGHQSHEMQDMETAPSQKFIDPVCGMEAEQKEELSYTHAGKKYYFCSPDDLEKFKKDPQKYVGQSHQR
ncbi:MAG: efflux RND transporter periplasmic adaptor subunit [Ignavibacteriales bacterium]|nr:efflux RND transporter periplasmic adaptor subunit [Ignavibacteriales bacterium]